MLNSIDAYLEEQENAFAQCEEFLPNMEKIKEAEKIGKEILNFVDENVNNINFEVFEEIDVEQIVNDLNIEIDKNLDGDILCKIYEEIEETFKQGGRVSLEDYLSQGAIVYNDMLNELKGTVDYGIAYSEKQLEEAEKEAFERFNLVLAMHNFKDIAECFNLSDVGKLYLDKSEKYLTILGNDTPYAGKIEEKIAEINYTVLLSATLESKLDCKVSDKIELNNFFSDKLNDLLEDLAKYKDDKKIQAQFEEMCETIKTNSSNEVVSQLIQKLDKINEKIFDKKLEKDKNKERDDPSI